MIQAFNEWFFWKDFKTAVVLWMPLHHSLVMACVFQSCMLRWKKKNIQVICFINNSRVISNVAYIEFVPVKGIIINIK